MTDQRDHLPEPPIPEIATPRRTLLKAGVAVGALLGAPALPEDAQASTVPKRGGSLRIQSSKVINLNPGIQSGIATMIPGAQLFAGLVEFDADWKPHPFLAESWEASKDKLAHTFHLRRGATFHDGKPITSGDVAFSLFTVKNNHPFGVAMFGGVDKIDTPDPSTVIIRLKHPVPSLLVSASSVLLPILPKHVYDQGPIRTNPANLKPVGSGPFRLKSYNAAQYLILERFDGYFREQRPYLDQLIFEFMDDSTAIMLSMMRGALDYVPYYDQIRNVQQLARTPGLKVTNGGYAAIGPLNWLAFNLRNPPLSDLRVRQAIAYAIDKKFLLDKLFLGQAKDATGPIAPGGPFYYSDVPNYDFDLAKADALLNAAGYKKAADGTRFSLTLDWNPEGGGEESYLPAQYLKSQLPKVGIAVNLRASPDFPTWARRIGNWDFQLTMDEVFNYPDPVIGVQRTYVCDNIRKGVVWTNTQGYCNHKVDDLFARAAAEADFPKRKALYDQIQKILVEQLPVYWLNEIPYATISKEKLGNTPVSIWGAMAPYDEVYWTA
ncbi:MAG: ABC transporter substrate-binding protein [Acetobacteraceae bacterium]